MANQKITINPNLNPNIIRVVRKVIGSRETGRKPYINFVGVKYRSDILSSNYSLIGVELTLEVDTDDLRTIKAILPDGSELGALIAQGKWCLQKHSLKTRQQIMDLKFKNEITLRENDDPITVYHKHFTEKSVKSPPHRNKLASYVKSSNQEMTSSEILMHYMVEEQLVKKIRQESTKAIVPYLSDEIKAKRRNRVSFNK